MVDSIKLKNLFLYCSILFIIINISQNKKGGRGIGTTEKKIFYTKITSHTAVESPSLSLGNNNLNIVSILSSISEPSS
jgi:hypothetical protein